MIEPTAEDIGRKVIYRYPGGQQAEGELLSFDDSWVFVGYRHPFVGDGHHFVQMAFRTDLEWSP